MKKGIYSLLAVLMATPVTAFAQWTTDYAKNTQITPNGMSYYENEVKTNDNGVTYAFFIIPGNPLGMRLQIVNPEGEKVLSRGGLTVSREPNKSWTTWNQHLLIDKEGNALVSVQDNRNSTDTEKCKYAIYRFAPDGKKLWDAKMLNGGEGYDLAGGLTMAELSDGSFIFAYMDNDYEIRKDNIHIEKLDAEGNSVWNKIMLTDELLSMPYPFVFDSGDNRFLLVYVDGSKLMSRVFDYDGNAVQEEASVVYDGGFASSKVLEVLHVEKDPVDGALVTAINSDFTGTFTRIKSDGTLAEGFTTKGVDLNGANFLTGEPSVSYNPEEKSFVCLYKQFDKEMMEYQGLYVNKFNERGEKIFDDQLPLYGMQSDVEYGYPVSRYMGHGRTALMYMINQHAALTTKCYMEVLNADGTLSKDEPLCFATSQDMKAYLNASRLIDGDYFIAYWDEKKGGNSYYSLMMQKIDISGYSGVKGIPNENNADVVNTEIFTVDGQKASRYVRGLNIVRETLHDGTTRTSKIMVK